MKLHLFAKKRFLHHQYPCNIQAGVQYQPSLLKTCIVDFFFFRSNTIATMFNSSKATDPYIVLLATLIITVILMLKETFLFQLGGSELLIQKKKPMLKLPSECAFLFHHVHNWLSCFQCKTPMILRQVVRSSWPLPHVSVRQYLCWKSGHFYLQSTQKYWATHLHTDAVGVTFELQLLPTFQ